MTAKIFYRLRRLPTSCTALKVGLANVLERVNYFNEVESCDGEAALDFPQAVEYRPWVGEPQQLYLTCLGSL